MYRATAVVFVHDANAKMLSERLKNDESGVNKLTELDEAINIEKQWLCK